MIEVLFISSYPPCRGNLSEYGEYIVSNLAKKKEVKRIIILSDFCKGKRIEAEGKITIIRCWKRNSILIPFRLMHKIFSLRKNFQIVHFNLHMMSWGRSKVVNFLSFLTIPLTKIMLRRKKIVVTLHNIYKKENVEKMGIKRNIVVDWFAFLAMKFIGFSDSVIVLLPSYKKELETILGKKKVKVIPHGTLGKKVYSPKVSKRTFLAFGFWRESKGLLELIEAFKLVRKYHKNAHLIVAGESHPNFKGYLEKIKREYSLEKMGIEFLDYVKEEKLGKLFKKPSIVVLPYRVATGTSGVMHLAASYGKPIIATSLNELVETAETEGFCAFFVEPKNVLELARAMITLIENPRLQIKMGIKNLKAAEEYSFANIVNKYVELYCRL